MARTTLGLSWLDGELRAVVLDQGHVAASWVSPSKIETVDRVGAALREAISATRFEGDTAVITLHHRTLSCCVQETPPAKRKLVFTLLARAVRQNTPTEEELSWCYCPLPANKLQPRFLLTFMSRSALEIIQDACAGCGVRLEAAFPPAAVLSHELKRLQLADDATVLLASLTGGVAHLLAGKGNGEVLFARSVSHVGDENSERLLQELNRTAVFTQQKLGVAVQNLWAIGENATTRFSKLDLGERWTLRQSPDHQDVWSYAREALSISRRSAWNLIAQGARGSPAWTRARPSLAWASAAALVFALGISLYVEATVRARERSQNTVQTRGHPLQDRLEHLMALRHEIRTLSGRLKSLSPDADPPIGEILLRHLAANTPESLCFPSLDVKREGDGFALRLDVAPADGGPFDPAAIAELETRLSSSPLEFRRTRLAQEPRTPDAHGPTPTGNGSATFPLEGTIQ